MYGLFINLRRKISIVANAAYLFKLGRSSSSTWYVPKYSILIVEYYTFSHIVNRGLVLLLIESARTILYQSQFIRYRLNHQCQVRIPVTTESLLLFRYRLSISSSYSHQEESQPKEICANSCIVKYSLACLTRF